MARWRPAWIVLLLLPVAAVGQPAATEDPAGDVRLYAPDGTPAGTAPADRLQNVDLVGLGVAAESPEAVSFFLDVTDLRADSETMLPFADPVYELHFTFGKRAYRILAALPLSGPASVDAEPFVRLQEMEGRRWRSVAEGEAAPDETADRIVLTVPRQAIVDQDQAPLDQGASLEGMSAVATALGFRFFDLDPGGQRVAAGTPYAQDRAPDDGTAPAYVLTTGEDLQDGMLFSASDDPVRWTNGDASTLGYTVRATNRGDAGLEARVSLEGLPATWTALYPERVAVPAQESVDLTFLVTIPFSHVHGQLQEFMAVLSTEGAFTKTRLGVYWPEIPQPAGHHGTLRFHGATAAPDAAGFDVLFERSEGWMNAATAEVDGEDEGAPLRAFVAPPQGGAAALNAFWDVPLAPALRMGLDFDLTRTGLLSLEIQTPAPLAEVRLQAELVLDRVNASGGFEEETVLASGASDLLSGTQSGPLRFEIPLKVAPAADDVPYDASARPDLHLEVRMQAVMAPGVPFGPSASEPRIVPASSSLTLPLFEYHDTLASPVVTDRSLALMPVEGGQAKEVNPGKTTVFRSTLRYEGGFADEFAFLLTGTNTGWAQVVGDARVRLEPGEERLVAVTVTAPRDARPPDVAELTLVVRSTSNAAVEGRAGFVATVTTDRDIPDEADEAKRLGGELTEPKESPATPLGALAAAVAACALALRGRETRFRRRQGRPRGSAAKAPPQA